jgi:hypothetical protein
MEDGLEMWTVYQSPSDYPGKFVVRRRVVRAGGMTDVDPEPSAVVDTLAAARFPLQARGLVCMPREDGDDPVIVETWF